VAKAFSPPTPAEDLGTPMANPDVDSLPIAGCFAAGEIGPVGHESYLHGQTACVVLFRELIESA